MNTEESTMQKIAEENDITTAFRAAYPVSEPSDRLKNRVAALQTVPNSRAAIPFWRMLGLRAAIAVACIVAVTIGLSVVHPQSSMSVYAQRVEKAVAAARSSHSTIRKLKGNGTFPIVMEEWYKAGKWRSEAPDEITLQSDGYYYKYDKKSNIVYKSKSTTPMKPLSTFSNMIHESQKKGTNMIFADAGTTAINGHKAHIIFYQGKDNPADNDPIRDAYKKKHWNLQFRIVHYVDIATDLPLRVEWQLSKNGSNNWETAESDDYEYNIPIADSRFVLDFPKDAQVKVLEE